MRSACCGDPPVAIRTAQPGKPLIGVTAVTRRQAGSGDKGRHRA
jgi:hypothetical protein